MKITSKFRMTARLSETDLALRPLLCSKVPVISRFLKYKLCPPPVVSRVLLSWQLVDPYLYESSMKVFPLLIYGPRSDKRDLMAIKVKSEIFTEKERRSYHEQLLKI